MSPKLHIIETEEKLKELAVYLADKEYIAFDVETTGVHKGAEIIGASFCASEDESFYVILAKYKTQNSNLDYTNLYASLKSLLSSLLYKKLILHNAIFDCMMVESFFKIKLIDAVHTDTMVLAHLLNENRRIGLKELSKEYFGEDSDQEAKEMKASVLSNGGKLTKKAYEMWKCDPYIMAKYGAKDALLTYKLFITLVPELFDKKLDKFFYEDESMPLLKGPTYDLNNTGLRVDVNTLLELKKTLEVECAEDMAFIQREIHKNVVNEYPGTTKKNTFSVTSNQQLSWLLFDKMGLQFDSLTKKGKTVCKDLGLPLPYTNKARQDFMNSCKTSVNKKYNNPCKFIQVDKKTLEKFSEKYEWIKRLLEHNKKLKLLNTYVKGIEERMQYGIIYPSFLQTGTTSGRYSSRNPNFQNLPRDDKRIKRCIIPRPGNVFVGADYSQLEPRIFAYFSNDKRLLQAFNGQTDFYSVIGMEVFDKKDCTPHKEGSDEAFGVKYKKLRNLAKTIALATTYGASARQLSGATGKSVEDTQKDIDSYFNKFPGVKDLMINAHNTAKAKGEVLNYFGRPRRMPEAAKIKSMYGNASHSELPYEARNLLNLAVNHTIQSTAASVVNRAAIKFNEYIKTSEINAKIVLQVHDSLVVECSQKDAENVKILLQDAMENTVQLKGIKLEAEPKIGESLSDV